MSQTQTTKAKDMTYDELYAELLNRGFHEDFLDEASLELLQQLYDSNARRN